MHPSNLARQHQYPQLPPLWPERQEIVRSLDHIEGLPTFPSWSQIEQEFAEVRSKIESGRFPWPPQGFEVSYHSHLRVGEFDPTQYPISLTSLFAFGQIPSVRKFTSFLSMFVPSENSLEQGSVDMNTLAQNYTLACWQHYGRRVFVLDPDTYDLLARTDLGNLRTQDLNAPHPSFFVKLPEDAFEFRVLGDPAPQPVEGVLVTFSHATGEDCTARDMTMVVVGRSRQGVEDDNVYFATFLLGRDGLLSEIRNQGMPLDPEVKEHLEVMVPRAVLGLCLYMESEHPSVVPVPPAPRRELSQIKNPAKRRKAEKQNSRYSSLPYLYVGRPFTPAEREFVEATQLMGGRVLDHPQWVRPHWKMQPYGPNRSLRKKIRISEYKRGPDVADALRLQAARVPRAIERSASEKGR